MLKIHYRSVLLPFEHKLSCTELNRRQRKERRIERKRERIERMRERGNSERRKRGRYTG